MAGQIIRRREGAWLVRVYLGRDASSGKRRYHNKTVRGTKKDAERYLTKLLRQLDTGAWIEPTRQTVAEYLRHWLESAAKAQVRTRTLADYMSIVEKRIIPAIGDRPLQRLTPADVQVFYNALSDRGLAPRTVRYTHAVLRQALAQAVRWRMLHHNPADAVSLPKPRRREMRALSPAEAKRFLEAAAGDRFAALWELLLTSGLRPSEALALRWSDLEGDRIRVQRSLVNLPSRGGQPMRFEEPKTDRARRTVPLPRSTLASLLAHRKQQAAEKLKAGAAYQDEDLIFATRTGGPLQLRNVTRRHFQKILEAAKDVPAIRLYDLRHSCATLMLAAGVHAKVVAERLGHASVTLTLDTYSHVLPDMQQEATERLGQLLSGA